MSTGLTRKSQLQAKLADEQTYATVLITIVLDLYGMDALQWSPDTLTMEIQDDFAMNLPQSNLDKLMCAIGIITSDDFFKRLSVFLNYCNILSGGDFTPQQVVPSDALECAWGIVEGLLLSGSDEDEPFTNEIRYYLGRVLDAEGIKDPPDVLAIALRDGPSPGNYSPDYSGMALQDADMFQVGFENQQDRGKEITESIRDNTVDLLKQLGELPLLNGRAHDLMQKLQGGGWHR